LANAPPLGKFRDDPLGFASAAIHERALFATKSRFRPDALRNRSWTLPSRAAASAATALTTPHFLLLFAAMLVAAAGNTALQSVMPAIGREIGIADFWVAIAYTWSAVLWVLLAPLLGGEERPPRAQALT
jgi:hypothetical protein